MALHVVFIERVGGVWMKFFKTEDEDNGPHWEDEEDNPEADENPEEELDEGEEL